MIELTVDEFHKLVDLILKINPYDPNSREPPMKFLSKKLDEFYTKNRPEIFQITGERDIKFDIIKMEIMNFVVNQKYEFPFTGECHIQLDEEFKQLHIWGIRRMCSLHETTYKNLIDQTFVYNAATCDYVAYPKNAWQMIKHKIPFLRKSVKYQKIKVSEEKSERFKKDIQIDLYKILPGIRIPDNIKHKKVIEFRTVKLI